ncbi:hypothetical protein JHN52_01095 [Streptomyces sp. MBT97]|uniref:hypothetical protein n=1 Tax=Streptomyces sp. MBT97 TaxID=2800411 RepID=UPI00190B1217|nr:hypothetical protein [Streptomyces sp. MBT97]MBK3631577.1 hypothetical protein [Streptomyces sp. MBT97]
MAHTFEELVEKQRTADEAHAQVQALQGEYGRPTQADGWTDEQTAQYDAAWTNWRTLAAEVQAAITEHAKTEGEARYKIEAKVKTAARHPEPVTA